MLAVGEELIGSIRETTTVDRKLLGRKSADAFEFENYTWPDSTLGLNSTRTDVAASSAVFRRQWLCLFVEYFQAWR